MTPDEIAAAVATLSLDEVRQLLAALRERLRVPEAAPDPWAGPMVLYGAPPSPRDDDQLPHALWLDAVGPRRGDVILAVRRALDLASLPEAKAIVDRAPCEMRVFEWREPAANAMALLRAMGATASMRKAP